MVSTIHESFYLSSFSEMTSKAIAAAASKALLRIAHWLIFYAPYYLIRVGCLLAFLTQISILIYDMINPTRTLTATQKVDFADIEFPLVFKVCIKPGYNETELRKLGYRNSLAYLAGMSMFNKSTFGWAGHSGEGGIVSNVSGKLIIWVSPLPSALFEALPS